MRYFSVFTLIFVLVVPTLGLDPPDFIPTEIQVLANDFIHIRLENRSPVNIQLRAEWLEKPFVAVYIDNIKRAEYKLKYLDRRLFVPWGSILLRTNFRGRPNLPIKVEVNMNKLLPESNYSNNVLIKKMNTEK